MFRIFRYLIFTISLLFFCFLISNCSEGSIQIQNTDEIEAYLAANNLAAQKTDRNLYYVINFYGNVDTSRIDSIPGPSSFIQLNLSGRLLNDNVFYDSDQPVFADLSNSTLIDGLKMGLQLFTRGGSGILILPSNLAYTSAGISTSDISVPPDVPVRFDVEILEFYQSETAYNDTILTDFITANRFRIDTTSGGTYIRFNQTGTGINNPTTSNTVTARYKLSLIDGTEIYNSLNNPTADTLQLSAQFTGLKNALTFCNEGTNATILIPSQEGQGSRTSDTIPAYSQLRYDITLESIF